MAIIVEPPKVGIDYPSSSQITGDERINSYFTGEKTQATKQSEETSKRFLEDDSVSGETSSNHGQTTSKLINSWINSISQLISEGEENWLGKSIDKSERYLIALYGNTEYRGMISTYLMVLRNNSARLLSDKAARKVVERSLLDYRNSVKGDMQKMKFLRSIRSIGLSPIGR